MRKSALRQNRTSPADQVGSVSPVKAHVLRSIHERESRFGQLLVLGDYRKQALARCFVRCAGRYFPELRCTLAVLLNSFHVRLHLTSHVNHAKERSKPIVCGKVHNRNEFP
jgi:hypothetical protein